MYKGELYMFELNNDIPKGKPQIPQEYLKQNKTDDQNQNPLFDINTKFTLENDLSSISVFKGKK